MATDGVGDAYLVGISAGELPGAGPSAGATDAYVAKFSPSGQRLWVHQIGSPQIDEAYAIAVDRAGRAFVTGMTLGTLPGSSDANAGSSDVFVAAYSPSGHRDWVAQLGSPDVEYAYAATVDASDRVYVAGYTTGSMPGAAPNAGGTDMFVAVFGASGQLQRLRQLGAADDDVAYSVAVDDSGAVYVSGDTATALPGSPRPNRGWADAYVARFPPGL